MKQTTKATIFCTQKLLRREKLFFFIQNLSFKKIKIVLITSFTILLIFLFFSLNNVFILLNYQYSILITFCVFSSTLLISCFLILYTHQWCWKFISDLIFSFSFLLSFFFWLLESYKRKINLMKTFISKDKINASTFIHLPSFISYDVIQHWTKI